MAGTPARPLLLRALDSVAYSDETAGGIRGGSVAVDLGAGEGRDTVELLRRGWRIVAIDGEPEAGRRLLARGDLVGRDRLEVVVAGFEEVELPRCALLNAAYALPFCPPSGFEDLWRRCVAALEPGGWFVGQFFGERDGWAALPDRSHQTRAGVERLLVEFEVEIFEEEERDGSDALGYAKHWHVFHVVARKRAAGRVMGL